MTFLKGRLSATSDVKKSLPKGNRRCPRNAVQIKKIKSVRRFGARYGKTVRANLVRIEDKQRIKQKCPYCEKFGVKRVSKGIWHCKKCGKKFASSVYHLR